MLLEELAQKSGVGVQSPTGITPSKNPGSIDFINEQFASTPVSSVQPTPVAKPSAESGLWNEVKNSISDIPNALAQIPTQVINGANSGFWNSAKFLNDAALNLNAEAFDSSSGIPMNADQKQTGLAGSMQEMINSGVQNAKDVSAGLKETFPTKSNTMTAAADAFGSVGTQLANLPLYAVSPWIALAAFGLPTGQQHYESMREKGFSKAASYGAATPLAATEGWSETWGLGPLAKMGKGATTKLMSEFLGRELFGEEAQQQLESIEEKGLLSTKTTPKEFLGNMLNYYSSGQAIQDAYNVFVGTVVNVGVMGGGAHLVTMPARRAFASEVKSNLETFKQGIDDNKHVESPETFQQFQAGLAQQVQGTPFEDTFNTLSKLAELTPEQKTLVENGAKNVDRTNPIEVENQQIIDKAIEDIKNSSIVNPIVKEEILNEQTGETVTEPDARDGISDGTSEAKPEDAGLSDVQGDRQSGEGDSQGISDANGGDGSSQLDSLRENHDRGMAETGVKDSIINTPAIPDHVANVFERIHAKLGTAGKIVMISADELQNSDYGKWLQGLMQAKSTNYTVDDIAGGRAYNGLVDPSTGKSFHVVALSNSVLSNDSATGIVGAHEVLGHITDYEHFEAAPQIIKDKINSDFDAFYERLLAGEDKESLAKGMFESGAGKLATAKTVLEAKEGESAEQHRSRIYREWKAHKITEAILRSKPAQTIMERFWDKLASKYKELWRSLKESNADIYTGTKSVEDFVNYLYEKQNDVENFNIKVSGKYRGVIKSLFDTITSVEDGKIVVKSSWLMPMSNKAGKTVLALRKVLTRYVSKSAEGVYSYSQEAIRTGHAQSALYTVQKNTETNSWDIAIREMVPVLDDNGKAIMFNGKPKTAGKITEVLASIPIDRMLGYKGSGPNNASYQLVQNIRDMLIILDGSKLELRTQPKFIEGFLQTEKGKAIKVKIPEAASKLQAIYQQAVLMQTDTGQSSAQLFLELITGQHSAMSDLQPGIRGVSKSKASLERVPNALKRDILKFQRAFPNLYEMLYPSVAAEQTVDKSESEKAENEEIDREAISEASEPTSLKDASTSAIESKINELLANALKNKKATSAKIFDELGWRYMNELSGVEKNYAEAYAKQAIEDRLGEKVSIALRDNVKIESIAKELKELGAITLSESGMQLADDMIVAKDKIELVANEDILGSYHDAVDGIDKLILNDRSMKYKIPSQPGSTFIAKSLKGGIKLGDLIEHPSLFKALPRLKDAKVIYYRSASTKGGFTDIKHGVIEFHINATHPRSINTLTLLHEIQHGVQLLEGFAYGTSPAAMKDFRLAFDTSDSRWKYLMKKYSDHTLYEHAGGEAEARFVAALYKNKISSESIGDPLEMLSKLANVELGDRIYIEPSRTRLSMSEDRILNVPNDLNDETTQAIFDKMYQADDLAVDKSKLKKVARPKIRKEGIYADILNEQIAKKERKPRAKPDPVKIQARREKMNLFIQQMDTLLQEAKRKDLSLEQYMITTGQFTLAQVRVAVSKYHANVSRFSQTEIVMRLATELGFVDQNGREPLEMLIKSMFPDRTVKNEETGKDELVKGSDGTVQSLGSIARGILIHRLQQIMVSKTGSEYNLDSEQTISERKLELQKQESDQPGYKKVFGLLKWIENDWSGRLSTTKAGKELVYRLKRYMWKTIDYQRDWLLKLGDIGKLYATDEKREYLGRLARGEETAKNKIEEDFVSMIRGINHTYAKEMELLQVKTQYKNGSTEYFKYNPEESDSYFPHMWEYGAFDRPSEQMIQSLIDSNEATSRAQALKLIKRYSNTTIRSQKFANIEMARETELGGWITDPIKVYQRYITQTSKRLAQLREFGATPELALSQFALKHFKEGQNSEALQDARDVINQTLGVKVEEGLMKDPKFGMTYGIMLATGTMLQHAVFVQPGTATNMAMVGGFKNLVKGIAQVLPSLWGNRTAEYRVRYAKLAGVLAFTMNKELYDIVLDDKVREKSDKILRSFGVTQVDSAMRIVGAMVGKLYAAETAIDYANKQTPKGYEKLKRLGLDPDSIVNRENPGILNPEELRMSALAFTEETNFVTNPLSTPVMLKNHPLGRIFMLFSRFAFQQHHLWKTVLKSDSKLALKGLLAGFTVGTPMMLLKMLLTGDDPEKVLERDGIAKMLWKAFTTGSGPGLFAEALGNAIFQSTGKQTGAGSAGMAIDSPAFAMLDTIGKGVKASSKIMFGDDYTDSDVNKALKGAMQALQMAVISLPASVGVPLNAVIGTTRPLVEKKFYPSEAQKQKSYLQ